MQPDRTIEAALNRHGSALLSFSGGKDSIAVLSRCRPWVDQVTVVYVDMGDAYPHVRPYVERLTDLWGFRLDVVETEPPRYALPTDMLPVWSSPFADWFLPDESKPVTKLISSIDCCRVTLWEPLNDYVLSSGKTLVLRGSKGTDEHVSVPSGTVANGIEYVNPIWEWTDTEVYFYLQEQGIELPMQYQEGCNHSLDCATCTGWLNTPAELQRIEFTRRHYPEAFNHLRGKMRLVLAETQRRSAELTPAINAMFQTADTSRTPAE